MLTDQPSQQTEMSTDNTKNGHQYLLSFSILGRYLIYNYMYSVYNIGKLNKCCGFFLFYITNNLAILTPPLSKRKLNQASKIKWDTQPLVAVSEALERALLRLISFSPIFTRFKKKKEERGFWPL